MEVTHYLHFKGSRNRWTADSPDDYTGFREVEFQILDRRGRPAVWLERRLTDSDRARIEAAIAQRMEGDE